MVFGGLGGSGLLGSGLEGALGRGLGGNTLVGFVGNVNKSSSLTGLSEGKAA